ncbi:glutathione S-transferase family protein [Paraburkholderia pallida]|uniref:Glutathione S-transferase family protein n=1 Tax=Paraburkholderia pallida TaxID=2547399 RepID=A0A4P7D4X9_9BURK|nr:glutathione S-transferase family protein [Paraburkholderia pallida]QBR01662.1 glutathione S-transferase family protein [Paraburkholderia pallida]
MGELIDGQWHRTGIETALSNGTLQRKPSVFRRWVTPDGSSRGNERGFQAAADRYHLYVSLACPWAHRALVMRNLKGLENMIGLSVAHWHMGADGWTFESGIGVVPDIVNNATRLHELYTLADPDCTSRVSVPVLWDKVEGTIVSNESSEIMRMFNSAFDNLGALPGDYYPMALREEIDAINARVYEGLNNGVYRAGFATQQNAYEMAVAEVFETLDWLETRLQDREYVAGDALTEADIRLFTTLVRFDAVYFGHFKCNRRPLRDYPRLWAHTHLLARHPKIRPTIDFKHIKGHYYGSHPWLNPNGIVPVGPDVSFDVVL